MKLKHLFFRLTLALIGVTKLAAIELSRDQLPVIVTPEAPSPAETYAAEELAAHLGKAFGHPIAIITKQPSEASQVPIIIGRHPLNSDLMGEISKPEESILEVEADRIRIVGGFSVGNGDTLTPQHDRGVLYGAYDLLEEIGFRWYRPEEWGDHIPQIDLVNLEKGRRQSHPVYQYRYGINRYQTYTPFVEQIESEEERTFFRVERDRVTRWAVRNRINTNLFTDEKKYGGEYQVNFAHAYDALIPKKKYLKTNPEYFALINGVRSSEPFAQLCLSNPEVEALVFEAILKEFSQRPTLEIASIDPNDFSLWCECDGCFALDDPNLKAGHSSAMPERVKGISMANRVVDFGNRIARRLGAVHPEKRVGWYAYHTHTEVPTKVKRLEANTAVMPVAFAGSFSDYSRGLYDVQSRQNTAFLNILKGYSQMARESGAPLFAHDYWSGYAWPGPLPVMNSMQDKLQHYHRHFGVIGVYNEVHPNWGPQGKSLYFYTWLLRNPDGDIKAEVERYYKNYYGPAAASMGAYHDALEGAAWGGPYFGSGGSEIESLFSRTLIDELRRWTDEASRAVKDAEPYRRRLEGSVAGLDYATGVREFMELKEQGKPEDALARIKELKKFYYSFSDGSVFDNRNSVRGSMERSYFTKYVSQVEKEAKLEAFFIDPKVEQIYDVGWHFRTDAENEGRDKAWAAEDAKGAEWTPISTGATWQAQGFPDYHGATWYRRGFKPPVLESSRRILIYFEAVDGDVEVFLNGKLQGTHQLRGEEMAGWDEPFFFDITDALAHGALNQLAVRVEKNRYVGGITGSVRLISVEAIRPPE